MPASLAEFVAASPLDRAPVRAFVERCAASLHPGAWVLDAGAGEAPYRGLFAHCDYVTADWANSVHAGGRAADVVAPLDALPLADAAFDLVLSTQVLEHVAAPGDVLAELARVLRPGGELWLTVPFVGELHEEPYDFFRYTSHGLRTLLEAAGLEPREIAPLSGYGTTLALVLRNAGLAMGVGETTRDLPRRALAAGLRALARPAARLDALDRRRALPLTWGAVAVKPG